MFLNCILGAVLVSWSNDLLLTFIGIELFSLCLYIMVTLSREKYLTKEAALKYFILGSVSSAFLIYGIGYIYGASGTTFLSQMSEIAINLPSVSRLFLLGLGFSFLGFLFKISAFPLQWWTPDVYEGSSTVLVGFMATAIKVTLFVFFLRLVFTNFFLSERTHSFEEIFKWIAVLTMLVGNGAALIQTHLKRMLAYSGIAHSGYILMGVLVAGSEFQLLGASGVLFYLLAYVFMTLGAFTFLTFLENDEKSSPQLSDLKGIAQTCPYLALSFSILLLGLTGIPLTSGFFW